MCGILGIYSDKNISKDLYYGLYSMQHRGQESCGMAVHDGKEIKYKNNNYYQSVRILAQPICIG